MIELTVPWLPFRAGAMTLWPFILYLPHLRHDEKTRRHESYHWNQAAEWGVLPWYLVYAILAIVYAGKPANRHPLEAPAYHYAANPQLWDATRGP